MTTTADLGGYPDSPTCPHDELRPVWGRERARRPSGYWCEACGTPFTPTEAALVGALRPTA